MRSITELAMPIYQKMGEKHKSSSERAEATRQYILKEVTQWKIKSVSTPGVYSFKPAEFKGTKDSSPFEVRLFKNGPYEGMYELKFGNLNAETDEEAYRWDDKDPHRMQKALFLRQVLESKILPMLESGKINAIVFSPYDGDGLGDQRYSYFYNMYSKLGKDEFDLQQMDSDTYVITKKHQ
jgi:hypothetical protein